MAQTPKNTIKKVEYILKDQIHGPECTAIYNGHLYTGTYRGELIKIAIATGKIVKKFDVIKGNEQCSKLSIYSCEISSYKKVPLGR